MNTLEELQRAAETRFPGWIYLIDEEPTIWKDFVSASHKPVLIFISVDGASVACKRNKDGYQPIGLHEWNRLSHVEKIEIFLFERKGDNTLALNNDIQVLFSEETLNQLKKHTYDWLNQLS